MPDTRRQVVLETIFFFLGLMFDAYSINLGASSAMKIFAKMGRIRQRLLTLSYTPLLSL